MDNSEKIVQAFKEKFSKMNSAERQEYLTRMGLKYHKKESRKNESVVGATVYYGNNWKAVIRNSDAKIISVKDLSTLDGILTPSTVSEHEAVKRHLARKKETIKKSRKLAQKG